MTLAAGQTLQLSATVRDESGAVLTDRAVVWGSSDVSRVRVSATGLLTAVLPGAVTITAGADGRTATLAVTVPNPIVTVESGGQYSCALRLAGELYCWGYLPVGTATTVPVRLASGIRWRSISAGYLAICGVAADSTGYCWGGNPFGGVGVSTTLGGVYTEPQVVSPGTKWAEIVTAQYYSCGTRLPDRAMLCWGGAGVGTEGPPVLPSSPTPQVVAGVPTLENLSAGSAFVCGREVGGTRWYCFGKTGAEELSPGTRITSATGVTSVTPIGDRRGCFVQADSTAACFGLGVGTVAAPLALPGDIKWKSFSNGFTYHYCGIDSASVGYCWGNNGTGQIGDGTLTSRANPTPISGRWVQLAPALGPGGGGSIDHTCGLNVDGQVYCWGANPVGQLGDGSNTNALTPRAIVIP